MDQWRHVCAAVGRVVGLIYEQWMWDQRVFFKQEALMVDQERTFSDAPEDARHRSRVLTTEERIRIERVKTQAEQLLAAIGPVNSRESALARTKVDEALMWAIKGITL